jgi:hypothetical protein
MYIKVSHTGKGTKKYEKVVVVTDGLAEKKRRKIERKGSLPVFSGKRRKESL